MPVTTSRYNANRTATSGASASGGPAPMELDVNTANSIKGKGGRTCYKCGKSGHLIKGCTATGDAVLPSWRKRHPEPGN